MIKLPILLFIPLYVWGGQGYKPARRFLAPAVLSLSIILAYGFSPFVMAGAVLYFAAANGFSYGEHFTQNKLSLKILYRGLCGFSYGLCGLIVLWASSRPIIGALQLIFAVLASIGLGAFNPFSRLKLPAKFENFPTILEDSLIAFSYVVFLLS